MNGQGRATVTTIASTRSFVDALAAGLIARFPDPLALARVTVLLPTRRACRALQEAFLRASGGRPLLLPILRPTSPPVTMIYVVLKFVEGILMVIGAVVILIPGQEELKTFLYDSVHVYVFGVSAWLLYYLIVRSRVVPAFIGWWGIVAIFFLLLSNILGTIGVDTTVLDYFLVLVITNEVFLAIWLMAKGFRKAEEADE